ncbi:MAG: hypothetical protein ABSE73_31225 [Planctomycetota bacterium]
MKPANILFVLVALALALGAGGCFTERDNPKEERAILKAGQQVSADMVGWVAVPNTAPEMRKSAELSYAVISAHNVVPAALGGWVAMNPAFFAKLTDIKVDTPPATSGERWVLKPEGKSVPKEKNGWIALPFSEPKIEKHGDREMAQLCMDNIIPKEMHGWAAVSPENLAKLVEKYMGTGPGSKTTK